MLRGLSKVNAEWGLVALAHNMIKKQAAIARKPSNGEARSFQFLRGTRSFYVPHM